MAAHHGRLAGVRPNGGAVHGFGREIDGEQERAEPRSPRASEWVGDGREGVLDGIRG